MHKILKVEIQDNSSRIILATYGFQTPPTCIALAPFHPNQSPGLADSAPGWRKLAPQILGKYRQKYVKNSEQYFQGVSPNTPKY